MNEKKYIYNTHIVIKREDALKYLTEIEYSVLEMILNTISEGRKKDEKKPFNSYYICNTDEPYSEVVRNIIINGESAKECRLVELRNIMDNSEELSSATDRYLHSLIDIIYHPVECERYWIIPAEDFMKRQEIIRKYSLTDYDIIYMISYRHSKINK